MRAVSGAWKNTFFVAGTSSGCRWGNRDAPFLSVPPFILCFGTLYHLFVFHCCLASLTPFSTFIKFYKLLRVYYKTLTAHAFTILYVFCVLYYCSSEKRVGKLGGRALASLFSLNRGGGGTDDTIRQREGVKNIQITLLRATPNNVITTRLSYQDFPIQRSLRWFRCDILQLWANAGSLNHSMCW